METWVWTWGGESFGYIADDALYTHDGRHVGVVDEEEGLIFALDGRYIGEFGDDDRLITRESRLGRRRGARRQRRERRARVQRRARTARVMHKGHRDFPSPERLQ